MFPNPPWPIRGRLLEWRVPKKKHMRCIRFKGDSESLRYSWFFTVCQPCTSQAFATTTESWEKDHLKQAPELPMASLQPLDIKNSDVIEMKIWKMTQHLPSCGTTSRRRMRSRLTFTLCSSARSCHTIPCSKSTAQILIIWTIFLFRVKADLSVPEFLMVFSYANDCCLSRSPVLETSVQLHPGNFTNGYKNIQDALYQWFFSFQIRLVFGVSNVKISGGG